MMKAHKLQQEDDELTFPPKKNAPSQRMSHWLQQREPKERMPFLKDQIASKDVEVIRRSLDQLKLRSDRIEAIKSLVNAGTYEVNSAKIAQKMAFQPLTRKILDDGHHNVSQVEDEE